MCEDNGWKYIIRFKGTSIPSIMDEFQTIKGIGESEEKKHSLSEQSTWVNKIMYRGYEIGVLEHHLELKQGAIQTFTFITNLNITKKNVKKIVNAGRSRWKIENEGFNIQKNWRYHIEHASSENYNAMKNHYLLTQITDIIITLHENGSKVMKKSNQTIKEKSSNLLESLRNKVLTNEDITVLEKTIQIRFS